MPRRAAFTLIKLHAVRERAFTLIELLVVVAIIAALIAILLPSMAESRQVAKRVVCGSQAKQHGAALTMYINENKGRFLYTGTGSTMIWGGRAGIRAGVYIGTKPKDRPINRYLGVPTTIADDADVPVFECPADRGAPGFTWGSGPPSESTYIDTGSSYFYNRFSPGYPPVAGTLTLPGHAVTDVRRPDYVLMAGDHTLFNYSNGVDRYQYWHDDQRVMANALFVDTHVDYVPVQREMDNPVYGWQPD